MGRRRGRQPVSMLSKQALQSRAALRRRVKGGYESVPIPGVEHEDAPISELFLRLAERGVQNECADGLTFRDRRRLQGLFGDRSQAEIEFLGSVGSSSHFVFDRESESVTSR
jgi:hypothetical protein